MFRRRMQRIFRGGMGQPNIPPMLKHANRMMMNGNYAEAQEAFENLAKRAQEMFPQRAPILYLQAGQAAIMAGDTKNGVAHIRSSLILLGSQQRYPRLRAFGQRAVDLLNARGLTHEAAEIAEVVKSNLPASAPAQEFSKEQKHPVLPTHCPSCGAVVRPDEVEWLDDVTAECDYCGSPVRG